jgi:hypothetical protein
LSSYLLILPEFLFLTVLLRFIFIVPVGADYKGGKSRGFSTTCPGGCARRDVLGVAAHPVAEVVRRTAGDTGASH